MIGNLLIFRWKRDKRFPVLHNLLSLWYFPIDNNHSLISECNSRPSRTVSPDPFSKRVSIPWLISKGQKSLWLISFIWNLLFSIPSIMPDLKSSPLSKRLYESAGPELMGQYHNSHFSVPLLFMLTHFTRYLTWLAKQYIPYGYRRTAPSYSTSHMYSMLPDDVTFTVSIFNITYAYILVFTYVARCILENKVRSWVHDSFIMVCYSMTSAYNLCCITVFEFEIT